MLEISGGPRQKLGATGHWATGRFQHWQHIYDSISIGVWQTVFAMLLQFSMTSQIEMILTKISDFHIFPQAI